MKHISNNINSVKTPKAPQIPRKYQKSIAISNLFMLVTAGLATVSSYAAYKYSFWPKTMTIIAALNILGFIGFHDFKNILVNHINVKEEEKNGKKFTFEEKRQFALQNVWTKPIILKLVE